MNGIYETVVISSGVTWFIPFCKSFIINQKKTIQNNKNKMSDVQSNVAPNTENVESTGILESVQHLATNVMDTAYEKMEAVKEGVISTIHTAEDAAIHMKDQVASTIISAEEKVLQAVHLTGEKAAETKDSAVSTAQ